MDQRRLVVEIGLPCAAQIVQEALGPRPHGRQRAVRTIQIVLLRLQLRVLGDGRLTHRPPARRQYVSNYRNSRAQTRKYP